MTSDVSFILDERLNKVNKEVEDILFGLQNPLAGEKIHIVKTFTKELVKAYARQEDIRPRVKQVKESIILPKAKKAEPIAAPTLNIPIEPTITPPKEEIKPPQLIPQPVPAKTETPSIGQETLDKKEAVVKKEEENRKETLTQPTVEKIQEQTKKVEIKEERIPLINSKITGEEMAYAERKGMFYVVHELALEPDEIVVLDGMRPILEKKHELFQTKKKFTKLMAKVARKQKININTLDPYKLRYFLVKHLVNFGLIDPLLHDPKISKIVCEGPHKSVTVTREGEELITNLEYKNPKQLAKFLFLISRRTGQKLSDENPVFEADFENLRINATVGTEDVPSKFVLERII